MKDLIIFGTTEMAEMAHFYFSRDGGRRVAAFTVDAEYLRDATFKGAPVLPFSDLATLCPPADHDVFVAIGPSKLNDARAAKCAAARDAGYKLATYVSSRATVWDEMAIGAHAFILEGNIVQPFASIGQNVVLWGANFIGHHAVVEDNVFASGHVLVGGHAHIGANAFLGAGCTIRDHVRVGCRCVIGAGAVVMADAEDESVYVPARSRKSRVPSSRLRHL